MFAKWFAKTWPVFDVCRCGIEALGSSGKRSCQLRTKLPAVIPGFPTCGQSSARLANSAESSVEASFRFHDHECRRNTPIRKASTKCEELRRTYKRCFEKRVLSELTKLPAPIIVQRAIPGCGLRARLARFNHVAVDRSQLYNREATRIQDCL